MMNIKQILTGKPTRLRYIKRFSICPRVHEESVAEHSYYVAFIAMMIAEDLGKKGYPIDIGKLLCRALVHDIDEVFSGDFIRMFKHDNSIINSAIDATSSKLTEKFFESYPAGDRLFKYWQESKGDDIEGQILAYSDFLSVVSYIWQELNAGNVIMKQQLSELRKFAELFAGYEYAFLNEYTKGVQLLLDEMEG